jgi:hypothetical protein
MVIRSASGQAEVIDFRETAPAAATVDMYHGNATLSRIGGLAVGVPGELRGLALAHSRHGKLPWATILNRAADIANNGYAVTSSLATAIQRNADYIWADDGLRSVYTIGDRLAVEVRPAMHARSSSPCVLFSRAIPFPIRRSVSPCKPSPQRVQSPSTPAAWPRVLLTLSLLLKGESSPPMTCKTTLRVRQCLV